MTTVTRLRRRLDPRGEQGVALVIAVLILAIITISTASVIFYTDGSQRDAFSKKSGQTAYTLAQAALSNATAQLTSHYYDSDGQPFDNTTTLATMAANWAPSGSQKAPNDTASCTTAPQSTCMTWSAVLNCPNTGTDCPGGSTIAVTGTEKAAWHVTAVGTVPNPSGTQAITRTITVDIPVLAPPAATHQVPDIYKSVYSGGTGHTCDMDMIQGTVFQSPVYVVGNLCVENPQAGVVYNGTLAVGGYLYMKPGSSGKVGTSTSPLTSLAVGGACNQSYSSSPACQLTKPAGKTYYTDFNVSDSIFTTTQVSNSPTFPPAPSVDFTNAATESQPYSCTGVESLATTPFDLAPSSGDYSCSAPSGSIAWNHSTHTLTVDGNVYVFGSLVTNNGPQILYSGLGGIFVNGTATFSNNTEICVNGFQGQHDCTGGANWDTENDFLIVFAQGNVSGKNIGLQGGLYSDAGNIDFGSGQTSIYGPLITPNQLIPGQQAASGFPVINQVISGWTEAPAPLWRLGTPTNGTY